MKKEEIIWGSIPIIGLETEEDLKKYTQAYLAKGENGRIWHLNKTENELKKINNKKSKSHLGLKESYEVRKKKSDSSKGKPKSDEHKKKLSLSKIGTKQSEETKKKKKLIFTGEGNPMFGKNHSKKSRKKISENHAAKVIKVCPHCKKECPSNNYPRYHGDNCKHNPNHK